MDWTSQATRKKTEEKKKESGHEVGRVIYKLFELFTFVICEVSR